MLELNIRLEVTHVTVSKLHVAILNPNNVAEAPAATEQQYIASELVLTYTLSVCLLVLLELDIKRLELLRYQ